MCADSLVHAREDDLALNDIAGRHRNGCAHARCDEAGVGSVQRIGECGGAAFERLAVKLVSVQCRHDGAFPQLIIMALWTQASERDDHNPVVARVAHVAHADDHHQESRLTHLLRIDTGSESA